jgi:hypothetical protein
VQEGHATAAANDALRGGVGGVFRAEKRVSNGDISYLSTSLSSLLRLLRVTRLGCGSPGPGSSFSAFGLDEIEFFGFKKSFRTLPLGLSLEASAPRMINNLTLRYYAISVVFGGCGLVR